MEQEKYQQRFEEKSRLQQQQFIIDIVLISKRKQVSTHLIMDMQCSGGDV